jgi:hypothetical protein
VALGSVCLLPPIALSENEVSLLLCPAKLPHRPRSIPDLLHTLDLVVIAHFNDIDVLRIGFLVCRRNRSTFTRVPKRIGCEKDEKSALLLGQKFQNGVVYLVGFFPHSEMPCSADECEFSGRNQACHLSRVFSVNRLVALAVQK